MKKRIVLMLAVLMAACMCACGSKDNSTGGTSGQDKEESGGASVGKEDSKEEEKKGGEAKYTLYDDLPCYDRVYYNDENGDTHALYISYPAWGCNTEYGCSYPGVELDSIGLSMSADINDYSMVVTYNNKTPYTGDIENIMETTLPEFASVADAACNAYYNVEDLTTDHLDSQEVVTLDCGVQAVKFSGSLPTGSQKNKTTYIYGYSFVYNKTSNITIGYEIENEEKLSEYEDMLKDVIDRAVKTIRTEE